MDCLRSRDINLPPAVIMDKDNAHCLRAMIQQALEDADAKPALDSPLVLSSNGDGSLFHDKIVGSGWKHR